MVQLGHSPALGGVFAGERGRKYAYARDEEMGVAPPGHPRAEDRACKDLLLRHVLQHHVDIRVKTTQRAHKLLVSLQDDL